jgi:sec-independent protein translocase protein TatC
MAEASSSTATAASAAGPTDAGRMSIFDHLGELRRRLVYSLIVLAVAAGVCFSYAPELFNYLRQPLAALPSQKMIVLGPLEMFITYIKLSLLAAVLVSSPFILLQLWLFVSPGLYAHEKRWVVPFVMLGSLFFVGGAAFCFYLVLPASFKYLVDMVPLEVEAHYSVSLYFSLVIQLMLAFGVVFELPLVMALLGAAGVVTPEGFAGFRKYWIVIAAIIGGVLTPTPDPMTQMMMAVPLMVFFELGIIGARMTQRGRRRADQAAATPATAKPA